MNMHRDLVPRLLTSAFVLRAPLVVLLLSIGEVVLAQAPAMAEDQEKPQAVIDAVDDVLSQLRVGAKS